MTDDEELAAIRARDATNGTDGFMRKHLPPVYGDRRTLLRFLDEARKDETYRRLRAAGVNLETVINQRDALAAELAAVKTADTEAGNESRMSNPKYLQKDEGFCKGCPPIGYPTDDTRCESCPRRDSAFVPAQPPQSSRGGEQ